MTQTQLVRAVAAATGETIATIQRRGFSFIPGRPRRRTLQRLLRCLSLSERPRPLKPA